MHVADWLLLAQTLILLGTGIVIYWYTRETQRLRQANTTQAELLREQVQTMRESLKLDMQEQLRASKPFSGGEAAPRILECGDGNSKMKAAPFRTCLFIP